MIAIQAYRRRRGWHAWNTAALGRFDFKNGYPTLEQVMGLPERKVASDEETLFKVRMLKAFLKTDMNQRVH